MKALNSFLGLVAFFALALFFSNCQQFPDLPPLERVQAQTHILNLLGPDRVDIFLETGGSEIPFGSRVAFGEGYPENGYASLLTRTETNADSQRAAVFIRANNTFSLDPVLERTLFFLNPSINTTIAMIDSFGTTKILRAADSFPEFTADTTAAIRFMNLAYHLPSVSLRSADSTILLERYNFLTYSSFEEVPAGKHDFLFIEDGSNISVADLTGVDLEVGKTYNVWFTWRNGNSIGGIEELKEK
ncbi:MAG: hypothetical protein AB8F95_20790 [Bacteroidia bacterium]